MESLAVSGVAVFLCCTASRVGLVVLLWVLTGVDRGFTE
jgi:hypothetical protein